MKLYECRFSGCRKRLEFNGYCPTHKRMQQRDRDKKRGTAAERGYGKDHQKARELVLERDKFCVCTQKGCHGLQECSMRSFIADHYPFTRRQLVEMGRDPNDPGAMRGLCKHCHDVHTGRSSAGGFIKRS